MVFCILFSAWMLYDSTKTIDSVEYISGYIVEKGISSTTHRGNLTYCIRLNNNNQYFGIPLGAGKDASEMGEKYNRLFEIGSPIEVYYDNNLITKFENISRLIYRIDYKGETIVEANQNGRRIVGFVSLGIGLLFIGMRLWLKRKYNKG